MKPKFIFLCIDCCFSGVGISDSSTAKYGEDFLFHQHLTEASGYSIFCASASDNKAREDTSIKNGRFTRLFIDIVRNKLNYSGGILNLYRIYQLIDEAFKNKPEYRQLPFSQFKGLSCYPLAYLQTEGINPYYSNHYIEDIESYDWELVIDEISDYCNIPSNLINEFVRLVREILRNAQTTW